MLTPVEIANAEINKLYTPPDCKPALIQNVKDTATVHSRYVLNNSPNLDRLNEK